MDKKSQNERKLLQWHPAFYAGLQIEFQEEIDNLLFENEHQLSKKPMEIDVLVIKKNNEKPIRKNIGRIFRKYNIIEYKSPEDYLSIDDFYKVQGYACFYKSDSAQKDAIKGNEITVSYVCEKKPEKLMKYLQEEWNIAIIEYEKGIYYIQDLYFPTQLIVTSKLSYDTNFWLRNLTNHLKEAKEAKRVLKEFGKHQTESLYKAMMNVIVHANHELFKEDGEMCEALMEILEEKFKDQLDAKKMEGKIEGKIEGTANTLLELLREGILTIQDVAKRLNISEEEVKAMM